MRPYNIAFDKEKEEDISFTRPLIKKTAKRKNLQITI